MMISEYVCKATDLMAKQDFMSKEISQDFWEGNETRETMYILPFSCNHCCHGNATVCSLCIADKQFSVKI